MAFYLSFIFGVGVAAWTYNQAFHRTHRPQVGIILALFLGLIAFIVFFSLTHNYISSTK